MSSYKILPYSYKQAKKLGVTIAPSKNPRSQLKMLSGFWVAFQENHGQQHPKPHNYDNIK
jgi:hypothetical protein